MRSWRSSFRNRLKVSLSSNRNYHPPGLLDTCSTDLLMYMEDHLCLHLRENHKFCFGDVYIRLLYSTITSTSCWSSRRLLATTTYIILLIVLPLILIPTPVFSRDSAKMFSEYILKSSRDNMQPCRIPFLMAISFDILFCTLTWAVWYQ